GDRAPGNGCSRTAGLGSGTGPGRPRFSEAGRHPRPSLGSSAPTSLPPPGFLRPAALVCNAQSGRGGIRTEPAAPARAALAGAAGSQTGFGKPLLKGERGKACAPYTGSLKLAAPGRQPQRTRVLLSLSPAGRGGKDRPPAPGASLIHDPGRMVWFSHTSQKCAARRAHFCEVWLTRTRPAGP